MADKKLPKGTSGGNDRQVEKRNPKGPITGSGNKPPEPSPTKPKPRPSTGDLGPNHNKGKKP